MRSIEEANAPEDVYGALFTLAPEPYVITDSHGIIRDLNVAARNLLGLGEANLLGPGRPLQLFAHIDDRPRLVQAICNMSPGDITTMDLRAATRDGCARHVSISGLKHVGDAQVESISWLMRDVTAHVQAEEEVRELNLELEHRVSRRTQELEETLHELEKANATKDEFLALVSHELRTPLALVLGNARLLSTRRQLLNQQDVDASISDILQAGERLHHLIENLMVLARLESKHAIPAEPMLLQDVLPDVVEEVRARFPEHTISVDLPETLPAVQGVRSYAEQVAANLLTNGAKYSPPGSCVELRARCGKKSVAIMIRDSGFGIPAEERHAVFEPFYRSMRTSEVQSGMGIGLAVVRRLMKVQGGRAWLARSSDDGSLFCFNFRLWTSD